MPDFQLPPILLSEASMPAMIDTATFVHLAAMATGLGAVVFADSMILRRIPARVTRRQVEVIEHAHMLITIALVLLWLSGLAIIGLKTGLDPSRFSPKLITKLATVSLLTVTAIAMSRFALPYMRANIGRRLIDAPLGVQCQLALCVAMSGAGWGTALLLGSSKILKTAGSEVIVMGAALHGLAIGGALALAISVYVLRRYSGSFPSYPGPAE